MPAIDHVTLDVRESQEPTSGFRGFTLSLVVSQPSTVDSLVAGDSGTFTDLDGFVWESTSS